MQSINQSVNYFTASEMTYIVSSGALNSTHYHYIAPKSWPTANLVCCTWE